MVKNLPAIAGDITDQGFVPLVGKSPLEEEMATPSSILAWKIAMDRAAWSTIVHRVAKSQTRLK